MFSMERELFQKPEVSEHEEQMIVLKVLTEGQNLISFNHYY